MRTRELQPWNEQAYACQSQVGYAHEPNSAWWAEGGAGLEVFQKIFVRSTHCCAFVPQQLHTLVDPGPFDYDPWSSQPNRSALHNLPAFWNQTSKQKKRVILVQHNLDWGKPDPQSQAQPRQRNKKKGAQAQSEVF